VSSLTSSTRWLHSVGAYLVVEDVLEPASAIVVLGGRAPLRTLEAARLYKDGWAPRIVLNQAQRKEDFYAFSSLGIDWVEEYEYEREALLHSGVPDKSLRLSRKRLKTPLLN